MLCSMQLGYELREYSLNGSAAVQGRLSVQTIHPREVSQGFWPKWETEHVFILWTHLHSLCLEKAALAAQTVVSVK